ncbi:MAG TPA: efflux RND transporter periplasmic adaptor subunit [Terriglobales bacterium]|nr:efflux RND transporter periplasmic adaptor subunit [Terriglobales bacterium]
MGYTFPFVCFLITMALQTQEEKALKTRRSKWISAALVVGAIVAIWLTFSMRGGTVLIRAAKAQRQPISATISTNGTVEPVSGMQAHAPSPTTVKKLLVKEGDQVRAGQLLLQLDDASVRADAARALAQVRAAEADLAAVSAGGSREEVTANRAELNRARSEFQAAQRNLEAVRRLQQTGAASVAELRDAEARLNNAQSQVNVLEQKTTSRYSNEDRQRAQAALEQARASYAAAQDLLNKTNIRSTVNGTVYSMPAKLGAFVNAGDLLVQVANLSKMMVRAFVDEPDIGRLAPGQKVRVTWDALPGRSWEGTVTHVPTTVVLKGSRTVGEVTCEVDNSDRKLLPNVNVSAVIMTARHENAIVVPREAVHQDASKRYVFQVVNNRTVRRDIETSISSMTLIEVTSGLKEGDVVALGAVGAQNLKDGLSVEIQK